MSRIDEALKRASGGGAASRGSVRGSEGALRLADDSTLNEYPREKGGPAARLDPAVVAEQTPRPAVRSDVRTQVRSYPGLQNEKLVIGSSSNVVSSEQYRRMAATLHEAQVEKGLKTVMVTSAVPKEGKTLTAVNLALTLAESYGRRVLLIDADLRRPSVHEVIGVPSERGLTDALRSDRYETAIVQVTARLFVLPSGRPDQNPMAGLSSSRMRSLLEDASAKFDWVVIDTPPVGFLPDAQVLGRLAQAVIFVIRAGATPFAVIERSVAALGRECIIGTVLNGVAADSIVAPSYYGHYYGVNE